MRAGPILCPSCNERVPRAAIRCIFCDAWLAFGVFRSDRDERAPASAAVTSDARAVVNGRVIYLTPADFAKLEYMATIECNPRSDPAARAVLDKLGHAVVMPGGEIPHGVLSIGSSARVVVFDGHGKRTRTVTLTNPDEDGRHGDGVSVMSPLGLALLGLSVGDSAIYRGRNGDACTVTVERMLGGTESEPADRVSSRAPDDDDPGPTAA